MNEALQAILPPGCSCYAGIIAALDEPLLDEERVGTAGMVPVRLSEYAAGRTAARRALRGLGTPIEVSSAAIPRNSDRSPRWPTGFCGSISHSRHYAVAVVARRERFSSLGVDVEEEARVGPAIWDAVMSKDELGRLRLLPEAEAVLLAGLYFSAKEAYYKCLPRIFHEEQRLPEPYMISIHVEPVGGRLVCEATRAGDFPEIKGCFLRQDGHWFTILALR